MKNKKLVRALKKNYFTSLVITVTVAIFVWLTWRKILDFVGNDNAVWTGMLIFILILVSIGYFNTKSILNKFG